MKVIPPEQIKAYLKQAEDYGVLPIFYLELTSGLRHGELMALEWSDLDVDKCTISVTKTVNRMGKQLVVSEPKTANSVRKVVIPANVVKLLKEEPRPLLGGFHAGCIQPCDGPDAATGGGEDGTIHAKHDVS